VHTKGRLELRDMGVCVADRLHARRQLIGAPVPSPPWRHRLPSRQSSGGSPWLVYLSVSVCAPVLSGRQLVSRQAYSLTVPRRAVQCDAARDRAAQYATVSTNGHAMLSVGLGIGLTKPSGIIHKSAAARTRRLVSSKQHLVDFILAPDDTKQVRSEWIE